ncbi:MAG: FRG domain-containing protein [Flavobacterium sp.]|nr:FRG domain-containing protein [Flavobacterium sp.]
MPFQGKDLMSIENYASQLLDYDKDYNYDNELFNQNGSVTKNDVNLLSIVKINSNSFVLLHGNEFSPILYRGQNEFIDPCKPSILRDSLTPLERKISEIKKLEFFDVIVQHPMIKYLKNYTEFGYKFSINYEAIAQHYEFKTNHLDLTRSHNVAMFFATTKKVGNEYQIINEPQEGVIYKINLKKAWELNPNNITPIGFQPLNRPDQQYAFSVVLEENMNFNTMPFVECERFTITKELSEKYFNMFDRGDKLFPKGIVSDMAYKIHSSSLLHRGSIRHYCQKNKINESEFITTLEKYQIGIRDVKYNISRADIHLLKKRLYNEIFYLRQRVHIRGSSAHLELL